MDRINLLKITALTVGTAMAGLLLLLASPAESATSRDLPAAPLVLGQVRKLPFPDTVGTREINIVLPVGYSKQPERRYPVLYLLDGGMEQDLIHVAGVVQLGAAWGRSSEVIVVGIQSDDRRNELTGPPGDPEIVKKYPTAGASEAFRRFLREKVKPMIEREYRTNGQDGLIGESLAGLFTVETYLVEPSLFDRYAAIDPSLWWDREALTLRAHDLVNQAHRAHPLYISEAREQLDEPAAMDRLVAVLKSKQADWCRAARADLFHSTIYQQLTPQAVQFLFPPEKAPPTEYGFVVNCTDGGSSSPVATSKLKGK